MYESSRALKFSKTAGKPVFERSRTFCIATCTALLGFLSSPVAADKPFSLPDLEALVDACIQQTDLDYENQPQLPIKTQETRFSEVGLKDVARFEEATKLSIVDISVGLLFTSETADTSYVEVSRQMHRMLEDKKILERHHETVLRQVGANALWKNTHENARWDGYGIVGGSAWWFAEDIAVVWDGSSFHFSGYPCEIYGVPSGTATQLVEDEGWNFTSETFGPITRYSATIRARAPLSRILVRLVTGIGKNHRLPNAKIEVFRFDQGFLTVDSPEEWVIKVSRDRRL